MHRDGVSNTKAIRCALFGNVHLFKGPRGNHRRLTSKQSFGGILLCVICAVVAG